MTETVDNQNNREWQLRQTIRTIENDGNGGQLEPIIENDGNGGQSEQLRMSATVDNQNNRE